MADVSSSAFYLIRKGFLIAIATTLIGLVVPGLVAYREKIFDAESMAEHISSRLSPQLQDQLKNYRTLKAESEKKLLQIDTTYVSPGQLTSEQVTSLNAQRAVAERLASATPPVTFLPFYLSSAMLLWVLSLTPLAWLALLFYPGKSAFDSLNLSQVFGTGLLAYGSYQWTVWMRYFVLKNYGRKVIGFANYDVSHGAFWLQELHTILFWFLLSVVCFQSLSFAETLAPPKSETRETLAGVTNAVSVGFLRWQLTSVLLALSFIPFTAFYWDLVVHARDARFLTAAIILHVMWIVAWVVISVPLFRAWSHWRSFKVLALEKALESHTTNELMPVLEGAEPIGDWAKVISGTLATLSFGAPLLKALLSQ